MYHMFNLTVVSASIGIIFEDVLILEGLDWAPLFSQETFKRIRFHVIIIKA